MKKIPHEPSSIPKDPESQSLPAFYRLSEVAQFHTADKRFGEADLSIGEAELRAEISEIRYDRIQNVLKESTPEKAEKGAEEKEALSTSEGRYLKKIIEDVFKVKLKRNAKKDPEAWKKLESCRKKVREYLNNVLNSVKDYLGSILNLESEARSGDKTKIANADDKRKLSHNALMKNINILNRSLEWWYGKFDPSQLSDAQTEMFEKQKELYVSDEFERIEIPANGICPPSYSIDNRKEITRWAKAIYKDLVSIQRLP